MNTHQLMPSGIPTRYRAQVSYRDGDSYSELWRCYHEHESFESAYECAIQYIKAVAMAMHAKGVPK